MDAGDDESRSFLVSAYCCVLLQPPLAHVNQPNAIVNDKYYQHL
jgi:hypothetical protein